MCKYCKVNKQTAGDLVGSNLIGSIKEGNFEVDVTLERYAENENDKFNNRIQIEELVKIDGSFHSVKYKEFKIKYCPFCGEKL